MCKLSEYGAVFDFIQCENEGGGATTGLNVLSVGAKQEPGVTRTGTGCVVGNVSSY